MDDYCDRTYPGWTEAIAEAERRCIRVWVNNEEVWAVPWTELVQIRKLVELASRPHVSGREDDTDA